MPCIRRFQRKYSGARCAVWFSSDGRVCRPIKNSRRAADLITEAGPAAGGSARRTWMQHGHGAAHKPTSPAWGEVEALHKAKAGQEHGQEGTKVLKVRGASAPLAKIAGEIRPEADRVTPMLVMLSKLLLSVCHLFVFIQPPPIFQPDFSQRQH